MATPLSAPFTDLAAAFGQHTSPGETEHRPWPLPERGWIMGQSWYDLLFAHWRVEAEELGRMLPPQLPLDLIDGSAWIGISPFELRAARSRFLPPPPFLSVFCELNVRTYVTVDGKPGIYFISLDAASRLAVHAARWGYRLPYYHARMSIEREQGAVRYRSRRTDDDGPGAELDCAYAPEGGTFNAAPDSLEAALIERYCAYTLDDHGTVNRIEIHHRPWELRRARGEFELNTMTAQIGVELSGEPLLHFAPRQDVTIWPLAPVRAV